VLSGRRALLESGGEPELVDAPCPAGKARFLRPPGRGAKQLEFERD